MKVLVVEDHQFVGEALCDVVRALDEHVETLTASNPDAALACVAEHPDLDLLLLDLLLPGQSDDFATLSVLRQRHPDIPVVIVSARVDAEAIRRAIDMGAMGYVPKVAERATLLDALRLVLRGQIYVPPEAIGHGAAHASPTPPASAEAEDPLERFRLTPREREILALLVHGKPDKVIARTYGISTQTVKNHETSIRRKLDASNRSELIYKLARAKVELDRIAAKDPADASPRGGTGA